MKHTGRFVAGLFTALVLLVSCKPHTDLIYSDRLMNSVPDSVLPVDTMVAVLVDIHIAESYISNMKNDSLPEANLEHQYAIIMSMHKISEEEFLRSYHWYVTEPVLMNYIYGKITDRLNLLESTYKIGNGPVKQTEKIKKKE